MQQQYQLQNLMQMQGPQPMPQQQPYVPSGLQRPAGGMYHPNPELDYFFRSAYDMRHGIGPQLNPPQPPAIGWTPISMPQQMNQAIPSQPYWTNQGGSNNLQYTYPVNPNNPNSGVLGAGMYRPRTG